MSVQRLPTAAFAHRISLPAGDRFPARRGCRRPAADPGGPGRRRFRHRRGDRPPECRLLDETAYYRALARNSVPLSRRADSVRAGAALPRQPGRRARAPGARIGRPLRAGAPRPADRGASLDAPRRAAMPAITSPTHLRERCSRRSPGGGRSRGAGSAAPQARAGRAARAREPVAAAPRARVDRGAVPLRPAPPPLARAVTLAGQGLFLAMTTFRLTAPVIAAPVAAAPVDLLPDAELPSTRCWSRSIARPRWCRA